jgi:methyl coenzyme M reductase beta subunit
MKGVAMTTEDITAKLAELEARGKSNGHRIDAVEKRQDDLDALVSSVARLSTEQEHIQTDVKEIKADVKLLTEKPGKRWDGVADKLILVLVTAVAAYFLAKFGL